MRGQPGNDRWKRQPRLWGRWVVRVVATAAVAVVALVVAAPALAATSSFDAQPAGSIIAQAKAAMAMAGSVSATAHGVTTIPGAGKVEISEVDYSAGSSGTQQLKVTSAGHPSGSVLSAATALDVDGRLYMDADAAFWTNTSGLSAASAALVANRWVEIPSTDPLYATGAADLTIPSLLTDLFRVHEYHKGSVRTVDGVRAVPITYANTGIDAGRVTCDVSLGGKHLPVAIVLDGVSLHLGSWGMTKTVSAPVGAVPLSTLLPSRGEATT